MRKKKKERKKIESEEMKVNLRTTMAYFTLSCAASFLLFDVFIRIKREKKPERERKKMIVYILQESFSID